MQEEPSRLRSGWQKFLKCVLNNLLTILLVTGVVLGIVVGIIIRAKGEALSDRDYKFIGFPGEILIRLLKGSATPLIISCIIVALGSLDLSVSKTLGWQLVVYIFATKFMSSLIGLVMALAVMKPILGKVGEGESESEEGEQKKGTLEDIFLDMFRNMLPINMMRLYLQQQQTQVDPQNTTDDVRAWPVNVTFIDGMNILGLIVTAIMIGLCITILQERGRSFLTVVNEVYHVSMKIAVWILWTAPVCLFFLILAEIAHITDFNKYFSTWGVYIAILNLTYLIVVIVMYPLILFVMTRRNVFKFYRAICPTLLTAYVTSSSMASLPLLIDALLKIGIDPRVVRFVVPTCVNVNKDGSACFMALACVFVAHMTNVELSFGHYFSIVILAAFGSMAAAAVPFGAAIVLNMILAGLGLRTDLIGGILAVEWINDRGQTMTNICGNAIPPPVLEKLNKKLLAETAESGLKEGDLKTGD